MSLVDTFHRAHLERQRRINAAGMRHLESTAVPKPAPIVFAPPTRKEPVIPDTPPAEPIVFGGYSPNTLRIETIRKFVAAHYGVRQHDLLSDRRTANLVTPRHVIFYLCRRLTFTSLPMIGRHVGGRDHTTVLHGIRKIELRLQRGEDQLRASIEMLIEQLGGDPA